MPKSNDPNNPYISLKMEKYVDEYFANGGEKKAAFIAAGYNNYDGYGYQLHKMPGVQKLIADRKKALRDKFDVKVETILERLAEIADGYKRLAKFKRVDSNGKPYWDFTGADEEDLAFITGMDSEVTFDGEDGPSVHKVKITGATIADAQRALESLAKYLGMFRDKLELTGKEGEAIKIDVSDKELARRVAFILNKGSIEPDKEV